MSDIHSEDEPFVHLACRFLDGAATEEEQGQLAAILAGDARARRTLARLANQHGTLRWLYAGEVAPDFLQGRLTDTGLTRALETPPAGPGAGGRRGDGTVLLPARQRARRAVRFPRLLVPIAAAAAVLFIVYRLHLSRTAAPAALPGLPHIAAFTERTTLRREGQTVPLNTGLALRPGDELRTPEAGRISLAYAEETTRIEIHSFSTLRVEDHADGKRLRLVAGRLRAAVDAQPSARPMRIVTANAEARIAGTRFVLCARGKTSRLHVIEGSVRLMRISDGKNLVVGPEQTAAVAGGEDDLELRRVVPAFPGAEGHGAAAVGGRGGRVIEVTNLNDSGPGSFRAAAEARGRRMIVFRVGGAIQLDSPIQFLRPYATIAGQTAPGGGILLRGAGIRIETHDIVMRYLRIRIGKPDESPQGSGALRLLRSGRNVIVDHCSMSWTRDGIVDLRPPQSPGGRWGAAAGFYDVTFQHNIVSEGLQPGDGAMGIGGGWATPATVSGISVHGNLFAHVDHGMPSIGPVHARVINNLVYDWQRDASIIVRGAVVDYLGNTYIPGRASSRSVLQYSGRPNADTPELAEGSIHVAGNLVEPDALDPGQDNWRLLRNFETGGQLPERLRRAFPTEPAFFPVTVHRASLAHGAVLLEAGANARLSARGEWQSNRDAVDRRIIADVRARTGQLIADPAEVGGFPVLEPGTPCADTDHDGMPDEWEALHGFDPADPADGPADADDDGYTNVEEFLNGSPPRATGPTAATALK
ncbi:MAG: FecR domain-containing protein [Kiritimatiellae bacterium]|nr:FecR domain-containing protein [Kiritimatiellia bacterium]